MTFTRAAGSDSLYWALHAQGDAHDVDVLAAALCSATAYRDVFDTIVLTRVDATALTCTGSTRVPLTDHEAGLLALSTAHPRLTLLAVRRERGHSGVYLTSYRAGRQHGHATGVGGATIGDGALIWVPTVGAGAGYLLSTFGPATRVALSAPGLLGVLHKAVVVSASRVSLTVVTDDLEEAPLRRGVHAGVASNPDLEVLSEPGNDSAYCVRLSVAAFANAVLDVRNRSGQCRQPRRDIFDHGDLLGLCADARAGTAALLHAAFLATTARAPTGAEHAALAGLARELPLEQRRAALLALRSVLSQPLIAGAGDRSGHIGALTAVLAEPASRRH